MSAADPSNPVRTIAVIPGATRPAAPQIAFESFGVRILISASDSELVEQLRQILPPGWSPCRAAATTTRFTLLADPKGTYWVAKEGKGIARGVDLDLALELLESQLRVHIGEHSPAAIFVHAGVVARRGRALVLPGVSFAGKTTLVAELIRAGAVYYSDEFALVDEHGHVGPYAKPLSVRGDDLAQTNHGADAFGGTVGVDPLPVGAIVVTHYRPDAEWNPRRLTTGEGVLALLANTVPAQSRPAESLRALRRAAEGAVIIESDRGEAATVVPLLLAELERSASSA
jgi:hypothetical protein